MISKFREVDRAVSYMCEGISECCPKVNVALTYYANGKDEVRTTRIEASRLAPLMQHFCKRFPEATSILLVETANVPIGAVQCRCSRHIHQACRQHCAHHNDRPIACVMICKGEELPTREERKAVLEKVQEAMRDYQKNEKRAKSMQKHLQRNYKKISAWAPK